MRPAPQVPGSGSPRPAANVIRVDLDLLRLSFASDATPLIRVDFTDDAAWHRIITRVTETADFAAPGEEPQEYDPNIDPIDHRSFDGISPMELGAAFQVAGEAPGYALIADARSMSEAAADELTLIYVDLSIDDEEAADLFDSHMGNAFRVAAAEIASIEANLSIANMDFSEFANVADPDGVYRTSLHG